MRRLRLLVVMGCGLAVGCGGNPAPPTVDAAAEKEDDEQVRKANAAEGKKPKGKANPADE